MYQEKSYPEALRVCITGIWMFTADTWQMWWFRRTPDRTYNEITRPWKISGWVERHCRMLARNALKWSSGRSRRAKRWLRKVVCNKQGIIYNVTCWKQYIIAKWHTIRQSTDIVAVKMQGRNWSCMMIDTICQPTLSNLLVRFFFRMHCQISVDRPSAMPTFRSSKPREFVDRLTNRGNWSAQWLDRRVNYAVYKDEALHLGAGVKGFGHSGGTWAKWVAISRTRWRSEGDP